jgi:hypothetical protein
MSKLCIFVGMTVLGWAGWWLGARAGLIAGFLLSGVGSMLGVYLGWRFWRDYLG